METTDLIRKLLVQTWFGEVQGVYILRRFLKTLNKARCSSKIILELENQLVDESRHAIKYKKILSRYGTKAKSVSSLEIDLCWQRFLGYISRVASPSAVIVGVYGLVEPFNQISNTALLLPKLNGSDLTDVKEILKEEDRHIAMMSLYEEVISDKTITIDKEQCLETIRFFMQEQKKIRSSDSDSDSDYIFPMEAKNALMSNTRRLIARVSTW